MSVGGVIETGYVLFDICRILNTNAWPKLSENKEGDEDKLSVHYQYNVPLGDKVTWMFFKIFRYIL